MKLTRWLGIKWTGQYPQYQQVVTAKSKVPWKVLGVPPVRAGFAASLELLSPRTSGKGCVSVRAALATVLGWLCPREGTLQILILGFP